MHYYPVTPVIALWPQQSIWFQSIHYVSHSIDLHFKNTQSYSSSHFMVPQVSFSIGHSQSVLHSITNHTTSYMGPVLSTDVSIKPSLCVTTNILTISTLWPQQSTPLHGAQLVSLFIIILCSNNTMPYSSSHFTVPPVWLCPSPFRSSPHNANSQHHDTFPTACPPNQPLFQQQMPSLTCETFSSSFPHMVNPPSPIWFIQ